MVGRVVGYHPEIPDGIYTVRYCGYETGQSWNSKKVKLNFAVTEGDYSGVPLARYYNALRIYDPIGVDGDFDVGDRSHLLKEYRSILPNVRSTCEVDLDLYKDKSILALVEKTSVTGTGEQLDPENQYSVIRRLLSAHNRQLD